jgi:hypothetical protein
LTARVNKSLFFFFKKVKTIILMIMSEVKMGVMV